ncbi:unnamed protein product, partial [Medioppia subpectinata]
ITAEDKQLFNHLIQTLSQFTDKTSLEEQIPRSDEIVVKPVVENTTEIKSPSVVRRSDETITTSFEEKTNETIVETNVRRSGRTDRKVYTCVLKTTKDPNHVPKPKPEPKVIPDPESDPNSLLLLRRDNYDPKTQQFMCPNPHCRKGYRNTMRLYKHFHNVHHMKKKFICHELNCGKSFKTKKELQSHENNIHENSDYRPFECPEKGCDFKCKTESILNSHSVIHSDIHSFKCNECEKTFKTQYRLNFHLKLHGNEDNFKCRYEGCNQFFRNSFQLRRHKIVVHNSTQVVYACEWPACDYRSNWTELVNMHRRIHTGERPYECRWPACGKRFRIRKGRIDHERIHSNTKNYVCHWPGCGYRCVIGANLKKHMKVHQKRSGRSTSPKNYKIKRPTKPRDPNLKRKPKDPNRVPKAKPEPKVFVIPDPESEPNSLLLLRRSTFDPKTKLYLCPNPYCDKGFKVNRNLYKHFHRSHHQKKRFWCPYSTCGKGFTTRQSLKIHVNGFHSDLRPYECPEKDCGYKSKTKSSLDIHTLHRHSLHGNQYKCDECLKTFKSIYRLNFHRKVHSVKDPFRCRYEGCNQWFRSPYKLLSHKITDHKATHLMQRCEWPACGYACKTNRALHEHKRIHTGVRPYECQWPGCGQRFRLKAIYKHHELTHTNEKPNVCVWPGCEFRTIQAHNLKIHYQMHKRKQELT